MSVSPFDSHWASAHLGCAEMAALFTDEAEIAAMVRFESALAQVQGALGIIPAEAAGAICQALETARIDPGALAAGMAGSGIPVPALVAALRTHIGTDAAQYLHWGATTQDVIDTGLVLRLKPACASLAGRLDALIASLADQAEAHRTVLMAARTWGQAATPTTFGLRICDWLAPLVRHQARLVPVQADLLVVQSGGASGTMAAMGEHGLAVEAGLAQALGLGVPVKPWHADRDGLAALAGWLSMVTGTLGKMGADLRVLAATREARAGAAGGSSTMPQKANPVGAEALLALARFNAGQVGVIHQALVHAEDRDAGPWQSEWLVLPQMLVACSAALRHARTLAATLTPDAARMRALIDAEDGTMLAEAAQFFLARHMPRPEAQALVKRAIAAMGDGQTLFDVLPAMAGLDADWCEVADPSCYLGATDALISRVLAQARAAAAR